MRSIRSLPCAPAFVPSAFCSPPGSASTGQNPVTATSYNAFSEVTGVTFGSGDSEAFVYDPGTGRMTIPGVTGPYYDSNGNVIKDGFHSYTWDAEGLPHSVDSLVFTYGALGRAVEDSGGTQLVYNPQGGRLGFMSGQTFQTGRVPLMAGAWARYLASGLALYRHPDWLGSVRLSSTPIQGQPYYDGAYAPYGESYAEWGTTDHQFTGQKEDTVGDLYDFPFREYHSTQGRWLSPDPAGLGAADPTDPQSWNRYAYVLNNPTSLVDPLGLGCQPGTPNCKQPPECLGMVCADQYYGGEMFKGFTTFEMPICVTNGVMGYCGQGALASFMSPTGSDEFDALDPLSGVYVIPAGLPTIGPNGEMVVGTGTPGFNDLVWSEANGTSNVLEFTGSADPKRNFNNAKQLEALFTGDYLFGPSTPSATQQSPGVSAFASVQQWTDTAYIYIMNPLAPDNPPILISFPIFEQQWVTLPGLWFSGP